MNKIAAIAIAVAGLLASSAAPPVQRVPLHVPTYDVLIDNGTIYDGSGRAPYVGDVAINGDRIVYVGPKTIWPARKTINARG